MTRPAIRLPTLEALSSGTSILINQDAHSFSVGDPVYFDGADWVLAQADSADHLHIGVVSEVADAANCTVVLVGEIAGLSNLTSGAWYYLDQSTAGVITSTEPTTGIMAPVYQATSTTTAIVVPYIPQEGIVGSPTIVDSIVTTTDVTVEAGKHYRLDVSGMTADRNFILPAGADLQEVSFELITNAPADYELIIKGDTGVSVRLRQADAVTADEVTRCFIRGEAMRFVHDGTDWVCNARDDGRIACSARLTLTTAAASSEPSATFVVPTDYSGVWTESFDNANIASTSNGTMTVRRSGRLAMHIGGRTVDTAASFAVRVYDGTNTLAKQYTGVGTQAVIGASAGGIFEVVFGDALQFQYFSGSGSAGLATLDYTSYSIQEVF